MILYVSAPSGAFILPEPLRPAIPLVFIALGSGVTPIYGMLRALARLSPEQRPRVQLHYAYPSPADAIYGRELADMDPARQWLAQWHYVSSAGKRLSVEQVLALSGSLTAQAEWYVCGTAEFKRAMEAALARRGVAPAQIHTEMFSSPRMPTSTGMSRSVHAVASQMRLADEDRVLSARAGETLLETLERYGYRPDYSCRAGACGTCRLRVLAGQVSQAGEALSARERAQGYVLSCVAQPLGDVTLESAGSSMGAATAGSGGAIGARRPVARRGARTALRWTLAVASLALFAQTWSVTSQTHSAQAAGSGSSPSNSCANGEDDSGLCVASTPTPSGPSSISTSPTFPSPPSTNSGSSR
jgi:ferredoxin-NADP reductase